MSENVKVSGFVGPLSSSSTMLKKAMTPDQQLALNEIVQNHGTHLRRFVESHLFDRERSEDIVQEVYLRLAKYEKLETIENPRPFVFRVAENLMKDRFRRRMRRSEDKHDTLDEKQVISLAPSPDKEVEDRQELSRVRAAIEAMPEPARTAFILSRYEDMTYSAIADHMGVGVKAVEKYISTALGYLRRTVG